MHRIETSGGAETTQVAPTALAYVREALSDLQAQPVPHPAVDQALEAVAGSARLDSPTFPGDPSGDLSLRTLSTSAAAKPTPQVAVVPQGHPRRGVAAADPGPRPTTIRRGSGRASDATGATALAATAGSRTSASVAAARTSARLATARSAAHARSGSTRVAAAGSAARLATSGATSAAARPAPAPAAAHWGQQTVPAGTDPNKVLRFDAELGAHSATNFYKGLSGNDVIDSGGLFIATYQIPEIGKNVQLKVSLPGGYEFEAVGVVRWTRDAPQSRADSAPGFGVQFTHISPEGAAARLPLRAQPRADLPRRPVSDR